MKATRHARAPLVVVMACTMIAGSTRGATGQSVRQLTSQAEKAASAGRLEEAVQLFSNALALDPRNVDALVGRSGVYIDLSDVESAFADAEAALHVDPNHWTALIFRGSAQMDRGHPDAALVDGNRAIDVKPRLAAGYFVRAMAKSALNDAEGAIADFTKVIALEPKKADSWARRGAVKEKIGDHAGALEDFQQALAINPANDKYRSNVASARARLSSPTPSAGAPPTSARPAASTAPPALPLPPPVPPLPLPPPVPGASQTTAAPVRVAPGAAAPKLATHVDPVYPAAAVKARVQGAVTLDATIAPDGAVIDAAIVKSIPLLDQAAIDAVRQWVYEPTRQRGPILLTVTVTFALK